MQSLYIDTTACASTEASARSMSITGTTKFCSSLSGCRYFTRIACKIYVKITIVSTLLSKIQVRFTNCLQDQNYRLEIPEDKKFTS